MLGRLLSSAPRVVACASGHASSSSVPLSFASSRRTLHSSRPSAADSDKKDDTAVAQPTEPILLDPADMPEDYQTQWEVDNQERFQSNYKAADHDGLVFKPPADVPRPKDLSEYIDPTTGKLYPAALLPRAPKMTKEDRHEARHDRQYKDETVVRDDHPLWAFFHRDKTTGKPVAMENVEEEDTATIRPWKASELRLKSFQDLHTLWFLLLREKNIYYTQQLERRRRGLNKREKFGTQTYRQMIQLSMARIKLVASERHKVYRAAALVAMREKAAQEQEEDEQRMIEAGTEADEMDLEGAEQAELLGEKEGEEEEDADDWVEEGKDESKPKPDVKA